MGRAPSAPRAPGGGDAAGEDRAAFRRQSPAQPRLLTVCQSPDLVLATERSPLSREKRDVSSARSVFWRQLLLEKGAEGQDHDLPRLLLACLITAGRHTTVPRVINKLSPSNI